MQHAPDATVQRARAHTGINSDDGARRALWLAVIETAIVDAGGPPERPNTRAARRFLFDGDGTWAESRESICDMAGIHPEQLQRAARRRIADAHMLTWNRHQF